MDTRDRLKKYVATVIDSWSDGDDTARAQLKAFLSGEYPFFVAYGLHIMGKGQSGISGAVEFIAENMELICFAAENRRRTGLKQLLASASPHTRVLPRTSLFSGFALAAVMARVTDDIRLTAAERNAISNALNSQANKKRIDAEAIEYAALESAGVRIESIEYETMCWELYRSIYETLYALLSNQSEATWVLGTRELDALRDFALLQCYLWLMRQSAIRLDTNVVRKRAAALTTAVRDVAGSDW